MQDCIKLKGAVTYCVPYTEVLFDQQKKLPPSGVWATYSGRYPFTFSGDIRSHSRWLMARS